MKKLLRLNQIVRNKQTGSEGMIPVSPSTWWKGVKEGRFPKGHKMGTGITVWHEDDIIKLIESTKDQKH